MSARRGLRWALAVAVVAGVGWPGPAPAGARSSSPRRTVIIAVAPDEPAANLSATRHKSQEPHDLLLRRMASHGFAVGLLSTDLGTYNRRQALLDIGQGTRQQRSLYGNTRATVTYPSAPGDDCLGGWPTLVSNARHASVTLVPGLLASSTPGGAAFVAGSAPGVGVTSILAADRRGCIAEVSTGTDGDLVARAEDASRRHHLVVVGLPTGVEGQRAVAALAAQAGHERLVIVVGLPPTPAQGRLRPTLPNRFYNQTEVGVRGLSGGGRLWSPSTRQRGLVTTIDLAPTALRFLGVTVPEQMRGQAMTARGAADPAGLERLRRRWADVRNNRQLPSYRTVFLLALLVFAVLGSLRGIRRALGTSLRLFGLGVLWWPTVCLAVALWSPRGADVEILAIAVGSLVVAGLTDWLLPWPRGPMLPAVALGVGLAADLATGGHVLTRSVLGPSVTSGSRFYGISNEFEPVLPVVLLAGLAATATWRRWDARPRAATYALVGLALAFVVGWGRMGADVGGVVTVAAGFAGAVVLGSGRLTRGKLALLVATPVAALLGLVGLDLVSNAGDHLSNNLTRSGGHTDLWELVARRYQLALHVVGDAGMAIRLAIAVLAVIFVGRNRRLLIGSDISRPWMATLLGGLAAGAAGALSNDSGPVLFVNAVFMLVGVVAYLRGRETPDPAWSQETVPRWDTVGSRG